MSIPWAHRGKTESFRECPLSHGSGYLRNQAGNPWSQCQPDASILTEGSFTRPVRIQDGETKKTREWEHSSHSNVQSLFHDDRSCTPHNSRMPEGHLACRTNRSKFHMFQSLIRISPVHLLVMISQVHAKIHIMHRCIACAGLKLPFGMLWLARRSFAVHMDENQGANLVALAQLFPLNACQDISSRKTMHTEMLNLSRFRRPVHKFGGPLFRQSGCDRQRGPCVTASGARRCQESSVALTRNV